MSELPLQRKVIIVTGAGAGIGRALAIALAHAGASIVVNDNGSSVSGEGASAEPARDVVAVIRAAGGEAVAIVDSVASWDGAQRIVECAVDTYGRIDGVVNNAGILRDRHFDVMEEIDWQSVLDVHLNGSFYISRAAAPHMRRQESGAMVHTTSNSGLIGAVGQANYMAAKAGIVGLSRSIAYDMQRYNVRSNCVAPVAWSRMVGAIPVDTPERVALVERIRTQMSPETIAPIVLFLLSDAAAAVTGQIFHVRGNELFIYGQPRPVKSVHSVMGWTPGTLAEVAMPTFSRLFSGLDEVRSLFPYEAI